MTSEDMQAQRGAFGEHGNNDGHPSVLQLADYIDGELTRKTGESIRQHLSSCEICQTEIRHMESPPPFEVQASDPPVSFDSYEALIAHAEKAEEASQTNLAEAKPASLRPFVWIERLALAAAVLLVGWLWLGRAQPGVNGQLLELDLRPRRQVVRTEEMARIPEESVLLRLGFAQPTEASTFTAALFKADEATPMWQAPVKRQATGIFAIHFEAGFLEDGAYRLELSGDGEPLATYDFAITAR